MTKNRLYLGLENERQGTAVRANVPAPIGGLNTRDAESNMDFKDAITMDNVFPNQGYVSTRKGFTEYVNTGLTGDIETLPEYFSGSTRKFLCANNGEINDVTDPNSISNLGSGYNSDRWQWVMQNANMLLVNGNDTPQVFDGSSLSNSTISGSGLTPADLDGVNLHKNRLYVWNSDTPDFWYGGVDAVGGTFNKFQLGLVAPNGGNLISMQTWNLDGGDGVDDYALFLMSSGDAILYSGSNPGDSSNWSLIGIYRIGRPLSIRGAKKIGGDVAIITDQDFVLFSQVFKSGGVISSQSKLSGAAQSVTQLYSSNYGWEVAIYPKGGWLIFNVPVATTTTYHQYVVNTITGAACRFTGMNAQTFGLYNNNLYFGGNGAIYKADDGFDDDGEFIEADVQQAYNNLSVPAEKSINSYRNILELDGNVEVNSSLNYDYGLSSITQATSTESTGTAWDEGDWDTFFWSPENETRKELIYGSGSGVDVSMRLAISLKGQQVYWHRTDYSYTVNNIL